MDSEKIVKKISKIFWILGVVTGLQVDFLSDPQLSSTFGDLILIELAKGFNLRHMRVLRSLKLKSYNVITKKFFGSVFPRCTDHRQCLLTKCDKIKHNY